MNYLLQLSQKLFVHSKMQNLAENELMNQLSMVIDSQNVKAESSFDNNELDSGLNLTQLDSNFKQQFKEYNEFNDKNFDLLKESNNKIESAHLSLYENNLVKRKPYKITKGLQTKALTADLLNEMSMQAKSKLIEKEREVESNISTQIENLRTLLESIQANQRISFNELNLKVDLMKISINDRLDQVFSKFNVLFDRARTFD